MLKTAERLDLTKVGALEQLEGFIEGRENGITTRYRARYICDAYILLWCLYKLSGILYSAGGLLSQGILAVIIIH